MRGPVDLEAGRGVSALDMQSISGAWLLLAKFLCAQKIYFLSGNI